MTAGNKADDEALSAEFRVSRESAPLPGLDPDVPPPDPDGVLPYAGATR